LKCRLTENQRHRKRERNHVALRMVPDDRDPEEERVGREGADRDDDTERGEPSGGRHMRILPRTAELDPSTMRSRHATP